MSFIKNQIRKEKLKTNDHFRNLFKLQHKQEHMVNICVFTETHTCTHKTLFAFYMLNTYSLRTSTNSYINTLQSSHSLHICIIFIRARGVHTYTYKQTYTHTNTHTNTQKHTTHDKYIELAFVGRAQSGNLQK